MPYDAIAPLGTVNVVTGTTSASVALFGEVGEPKQVLVTNLSAANAFVIFGMAGLVATAANGVPMAPNTARVFSVGRQTHVAAILSTGAGVLYATTGHGS